MEAGKRRGDKAECAPGVKSQRLQCCGWQQISAYTPPPWAQTHTTMGLGGEMANLESTVYKPQARNTHCLRAVLITVLKTLRALRGWLGRLASAARAMCVGLPACMHAKDVLYIWVCVACLGEILVFNL